MQESVGHGEEAEKKERVKDEEMTESGMRGVLLVRVSLNVWLLFLFFFFVYFFFIFKHAVDLARERGIQEGFNGYRSILIVLLRVLDKVHTNINACRATIVSLLGTEEEERECVCVRERGREEREMHQITLLT